MAAGGPAGKTRVTLAGIGTARPALSVTLWACAAPGVNNAADRPAKTVRRSTSISRSAPNAMGAGAYIKLQGRARLSTPLGPARYPQSGRPGFNEVGRQGVARDW